MPQVAKRVSRAQVMAAVTALGFDPTVTVELHIFPDVVTLTQDTGNEHRTVSRYKVVAEDAS